MTNWGEQRYLAGYRDGKADAMKDVLAEIKQTNADIRESIKSLQEDDETTAKLKAITAEIRIVASYTISIESGNRMTVTAAFDTLEAAINWLYENTVGTKGKD